MMYYRDFIMLSAKLHDHTFTMLPAGPPGGWEVGYALEKLNQGPLCHHSNTWTMADPVSDWSDFHRSTGILGACKEHQAWWNWMYRNTSPAACLHPRCARNCCRSRTPPQFPSTYRVTVPLPEKKQFYQKITDLKAPSTESSWVYIYFFIILSNLYNSLNRKNILLIMKWNTRMKEL